MRRQMFEQQERRVVGPVQVVEQKNDGHGGRAALEILSEPCEEEVTLLIRRQVERIWNVGKELAQSGHDARDLGRTAPERRPQTSGWRHTRAVLELLDEWE